MNLPPKDDIWFTTINWNAKCMKCMGDGECSQRSCAEFWYDPWGDHLPPGIFHMDGNNLEEYPRNKAEADLEDAGARHPDEIFDYRSEKAFRGHLKEHGLNPDKYIKSDSSGSSNSSNSACYLTTACVVSRGLPDDCDELQTLRAFRDSYLAALPNGREEIDRYYQMAPSVVAAINQQENHKSIWEQVYTELIVPCVRMIKAKENDSAYQLYKSYSLKLYEEYCG